MEAAHVVVNGQMGNRRLSQATLSPASSRALRTPFPASRCAVTTGTDSKHIVFDRERAKLELRAARLLTQIDDDLGAPDRQAGCAGR